MLHLHTCQEGKEMTAKYAAKEEEEEEEEGN